MKDVLLRELFVREILTPKDPKGLETEGKN